MQCFHLFIKVAMEMMMVMVIIITKMIMLNVMMKMIDNDGMPNCG